MAHSSIKYSLLAATALASAMTACSDSGDSSGAVESHTLPDTLRVGTLYSPTSYFMYRDMTMGYDYDMVSRLAEDKGMVLDLTVASSLQSAIEMLDSGLVDMIAYEVPVTAEYREHVVPAGIETVTTQVLVQPRRSSGERITDVTQLVGRKVYVEKDSKYHHRMDNLNEELGGGIEVIPIDRDTLITEDLISMVSRKEIPLTVVDSDIARLNKTYYNDLDITMQVSFPQRAAWGVSPRHAWLADTISEWMKEERPRATRDVLLKRYFEISKRSSHAPSFSFKLDFSHGRISPFDHLFRKYAAPIGYDWRLLAAQGYCESQFDSTVVSWAGAKGIMQIMPSVAPAYGLTPETMTHNEPNIAASARIVSSLDKILASKVPDKEERKKFIVAAYNSGIAHILDAIAIADKFGLNPRLWDGQVEHALMMKSNPDVYNDPVCKYGYFRGSQTVEYVRRVFDFYDKAKKQITS